MDDDIRYMRRCLELARRGAGRTSPNPIVGCVLVGPKGHVLAQGWHRRAGDLHAEADALARLRRDAKGATCYVSLEPCGHRGERRTRPCAPLLIEAGVRRVVFGMYDPIPGHGGAAELRAAGIEVIGPFQEEECKRANAPFLVWAREKRAHVTLKAAMTLDGRIATAGGESRWITGERARAYVHRLRNVTDAVLVGANTVINDDPLLTVRGVPNGRNPVRVVLDGKLRMPPTARLLSAGGAVIVATSAQAPPRRAKALEAAGAELVRFRGSRVDPWQLARTLAERGLLSLLVEGGAETHATFLEAGLCDRLLLFVGPMAFGGAAPSWLGGKGVRKIAEAPRFRFDAPRRLGLDLLLEAVKT